MRTAAILLALPLVGIVGCDIPTEPVGPTGDAVLADLVSSADPVLGSLAFTSIRGTIGPGAQYEIAMPTGPWNGELVVFAHGMASPNEPVSLPDAASLANLVTSQGFALIYSSFSENGYAVKDGMQRTHQLRGVFTSRVRRPTRTYLVGASLGGLISVMLAERFPGQYDGVLSLSGLLGGGLEDMRYLTDARILFEYFFPGVIPGTPLYVPPGVDFSPGGATYMAIYSALMGGLFSPGQPTLQFANTAKLPAANIPEIVSAGMYAMGFCVIHINGVLELTNGHLAYDNTSTVYSGSADDAALNAGVARYSSDPSAVKYMLRYYTPTGELRVPVVALHTARDPIVPVFHMAMYAEAVEKAGASEYLLQRIIDAFGHGGFPDADVAAGFDTMVQWVRTGVKPAS